MKIMLLGDKGLLGSEIKKACLMNSEIDLFCFDKEKLDVLDSDKLSKKILELKPDYLINCVAYTNVDLAEKEKELAFKLNSDLIKILSLACNKTKTCLVHFSTEFIFDGESGKPYSINDKPNPLNVYGKSKLAGEKNLLENSNKFILIRTQWLYGANGILPNFVKKIIEISKKNDSLNVVFDQIGSPTYAVDLAVATLKLIQLKKTGLFHITNSGYCKRSDWAREILKHIKPNATVNEVPSSFFFKDSDAVRPTFASLESNLPSTIKMASWQNALKRFLIEIKAI